MTTTTAAAERTPQSYVQVMDVPEQFGIEVGPVPVKQTSEPEEAKAEPAQPAVAVAVVPVGLALLNSATVAVATTVAVFGVPGLIVGAVAAAGVAGAAVWNKQQRRANSAGRSLAGAGRGRGKVLGGLLSGGRGVVGRGLGAGSGRSGLRAKPTKGAAKSGGLLGKLAKGGGSPLGSKGKGKSGKGLFPRGARRGKALMGGGGKGFGAAPLAGGRRGAGAAGGRGKAPWGKASTAAKKAGKALGFGMGPASKRAGGGVPRRARALAGGGLGLGSRAGNRARAIKAAGAGGSTANRRRAKKALNWLGKTAKTAGKAAKKKWDTYSGVQRASLSEQAFAADGVRAHHQPKSRVRRPAGSAPPPVAAAGRAPAPRANTDYVTGSATMPSRSQGSTQGGTAMGFRLLDASAEFHAAAAAYSPEDMWEFKHHLASMPEVLGNLAQAIKVFGTRVDSETPTGKNTVAVLFSVYELMINAANQAAELNPSFRREHENDLQRGEAPRTRESMWDVGRASSYR